jgi:hypothetical protein
MRWPLRVAFALCALSSLRAAELPPRTEINEALYRWRTAVGDPRQAGAGGSVHVRSDAVADGLTSQVEEWFDGASYRSVTTEAGRTREEVWLDGRAWVKDENGKVLELHGRDLAAQVTAVAVQDLLFGAGVGAAVAGGAQLTTENETPATQIVRFTPKGGTPIDVVVDRTTGFPTTIVRATVGDTITLAVADWRKVKGRKVPFSLTRTEEDGEARAALKVLSVKPSSRTVTPPIARPSDGPPDYRFATGHAAKGIPFNFENDHLMVNGRVNGSKALWFMLDTGAEATIVNKSRLLELGVKAFGASSINGGGNSTEFAFADVAKFEVGDATLLNQRVGVIDLSGLEKIYGMPMGGLLGYDFFSRFVVRVDYEAKTIDLLDPSDYAYGGFAPSVPFVLEGRCPHVGSTIEVPTLPPIAADLIIDAGAADTVNLTSRFVKEHKLLEYARKKPAAGPNTMAGSEKEFFAQTSVRGRLSGLTLGPFALQDIPSNLMVGTKGAYASEKFSGTVGEGVLRRFNTIYNYSQSVMILEPNAEFGKPFPGRKTFGATFLSGGADYTEFTVTGVRKDSPAEAAGLKKGDIVVAADGVPAAKLRLADIRKLFTDEGAHRALTLKRGDETVAVEFTVTLISLDEN